MDQLNPSGPAIALPEAPTDLDRDNIPPSFARVTDPIKRAYLIALSVTPSFRMAAKIAGISEWKGYQLRANEQDTDFQAALLDARRMGITVAEDEAWERATMGWHEPVFGQISEPTEIERADGKGTRLVWRHRTGVVGQIRKHSDTMLIFMLKGHRPETYRERIEHTGAGGAPLQVLIALPDNGRPVRQLEQQNVVEGEVA